jgi:hypothetical protein
MDNFLEEFKKLKEKVEALEKRTLSSLKLDSLSTKTLSILEGGNSPTYYTIFQGGDQTNNVIYTLPTADGTPGQVLSTNGLGILSWINVTGGGGSSYGVNVGTGVGIYKQLNGSALEFKSLLGNGISFNNGANEITIINADKGSTAVSLHETTYNHNNIHTHSNKALLDTYTQTETDLADAVSKKHSRLHDLTSTTDHTSTATPGKLFKADSNGLPIEATNTDAEVSNAVSKAHDPLTVTDGTTIDFTLTGQNLTGEVKEASITESKLSLSDVTTLDVSTTKHGFVPKAPNDTSQFLRGDGTWADPKNNLDTRYLQLVYTPTTAIKPNTNSITALQFQSFDGTSIFNIDTTNGRIGIGTTSPTSKFDVAGTVKLRGTTSGSGLYVNSSSNIGIGTTTPNTKLHVNGSVSIGLTTKTANYTMTTSDCVILADATSSAITITLPSAANTGMIVHIKKVDSSANVVTISRAGTDTIEGVNTVSLSVRYSSRTFVANGGGLWLVLASS